MTSTRRSSAIARAAIPRAAEMVEILRQPPTPAEVIAHAESLAFSG